MNELRLLSAGISLALHTIIVSFIYKPTVSLPNMLPSVVVSFEREEMSDVREEREEKSPDKNDNANSTKTSKKKLKQDFFKKKKKEGSTPKAIAVPVSGNLEPEYPLEARQKGLEATVTLILKVNQRGRVEKVEVLTTDRPLCFIQSAIKAAKNWKFVVQGSLTKPWIDVEVPFTFKILEES